MKCLFVIVKVASNHCSLYIIVGTDSEHACANATETGERMVFMSIYLLTG